ncbi:MAG: amidohydrolase family protein, partial [Planctomycetota bacterium]
MEPADTIAADTDAAVTDVSETIALPLDGRDGRDLLLKNFRPQAKLVTPVTPLTRAKFPAVDVHTHFFYKMRHNRQALEDFVNMMDRNQIAACVSLDGKLGSQLEEHIRYLWNDHESRFMIFANVDWRGPGSVDAPSTWACHRKDFAQRTANQLREAARRGISGLKLFKQFGLRYKNPDGTLVKIDDPRWDPIWQACGELGLPVIIHTADPAAFFDPVGPENERWEELSRHPDWSFYGDQFPSREELLA